MRDQWYDHDPVMRILEEAEDLIDEMRAIRVKENRKIFLDALYRILDEVDDIDVCDPMDMS